MVAGVGVEEGAGYDHGFSAEALQCFPVLRFGYDELDFANVCLGNVEGV